MMGPRTSLGLIARLLAQAGGLPEEIKAHIDFQRAH
jgi:hypothetical protein